MNLNWDSLLEPIFLFILSLIAGTLWVIIPADPHRHSVAVAHPPLPPAQAAPVRPRANPPSPLLEPLSEMRQKSAELGSSIEALHETVAAPRAVSESAAG